MKAIFRVSRLCSPRKEKNRYDENRIRPFDERNAISRDNPVKKKDPNIEIGKDRQKDKIKIYLSKSFLPDSKDVCEMTLCLSLLNINLFKALIFKEMKSIFILYCQFIAI